MMKAFSVALLCLSTAAHAERMVTDTKMCEYSDPIDTQEMGTTLEPTSMFEIEYFCEFSPAIQFDWSSERVDTRIGHCSEPGFITPILVAFQFSPYEPGVVYAHFQGRDEPEVFMICH